MKIQESVCRCCCDRPTGCSTLSCHETDEPRQIFRGQSVAASAFLGDTMTTTTPLTRLVTELSTDVIKSDIVFSNLNNLPVVNESDWLNNLPAVSESDLMMDFTPTPLTVRILGAAHDKDFNLNNFGQFNTCGEWTQWNSCSTSCGGGFRDRSRQCSNGQDWDTPKYCNSQDCPNFECPDNYFNVVIGIESMDMRKTQLNKVFAKKLLKQWGQVYGGIDNKKALMFSFGTNISDIFTAQDTKTLTVGKFIKQIETGNGGDFTLAAEYASSKSVHNVKGYTNIAIFIVNEIDDYDYEAVVRMKMNFERIIVIAHQDTESMRLVASWPIDENYHSLTTLTTTLRDDLLAKRVAYQVSYTR